MSKKWFDRKTDFLVTAFIVLTIVMLGMCESADAEWSAEVFHDSNSGITDYNSGFDRLCGRYTFETGASFSACPVVSVGREFEGHSWEIGFADQINERWEAQLNLASWDAEMNGGFTIRRMIGDGPFQLGLGGTYWVDESPGSSSNFTFNLGMRYTF